MGTYYCHYSSCLQIGDTRFILRGRGGRNWFVVPKPNLFSKAEHISASVEWLWLYLSLSSRTSGFCQWVSDVEHNSALGFRTNFQLEDQWSTGRTHFWNPLPAMKFISIFCPLLYLQLIQQHQAPSRPSTHVYPMDVWRSELKISRSSRDLGGSLTLPYLQRRVNILEENLSKLFLLKIQHHTS